MTDTTKPSGSEEGGPGDEAETSKPAKPKLFKAIIEPATPEDYENGFSVGFMDGNWRDQPPMSSVIRSLQDRLREETAKDNIEPGA